MPDDGSAIIAKWTRKQERAEEGDRKAQEGMKDAVKKAMQDATTHWNIANELLDARQGDRKPHNKYGYGDDGEIITGYSDDRPWDRD